MAYDEIDKKVGENIRKFRKFQYIKQKALAEKLNKSLACISKYERGNISMDLRTLYECADALHVSPSMRLPEEETSNEHIQGDTANLPSFFLHKPIYYYGLRSSRRDVVVAALDIQPDSSSVTIYYDLTDPEDYRNGKQILNGDILSSETNIRILGTNHFLKGDFLMIICRTAKISGEYLTALSVTLDNNYHIKVSKAFLSPFRLSTPNILLDQFSFSREDLRQARSRDYFTF